MNKEFSASERKGRVVAAVDKLRPELQRLSLQIHANPEPAFQERKAAGWLSDWLERGGFIVERGSAGLETAFVARYRGGDGPILAVLAEYDALPVLGHACGHNIIGASAVGAAMAIRTAWPDLPGTVQVIGAPAEEGGTGKAYLVEGGVFNGVAAAMMVHPGGTTEVAGRSAAWMAVKAEFRGRPAHASVRPHEGRNALDALVLAYMSVAALRQHIRGDARIQVVITSGGAEPSIVPDYAAGQFEFRASDDSYLKELRERVLGCLRAGAEATGTQLQVSPIHKRMAPMRANATLAALVRENLQPLGIEESPGGREGMAATDMGNVSEVVPALEINLGIAPPGVGGHTPEFAALAASEIGMKALGDSAKLMAMTIADLFSNPDLIRRATDEFRQTNSATTSSTTMP